MKKVYHLEKCSTCQRILKDLNWNGERQEIRTQKLTEDQLEHMAKLAGSYEALFSRRAIKYTSMGLKDQSLSEENYKALILEEDTFLKRPVFIIEKDIFIGNSVKNIDALKTKIGE